MPHKKTVVTLYVLVGPTCEEIARNARAKKTSTFVIASVESGNLDRMHIHVPGEVADWPDMSISGKYKTEFMHYRMIYNTTTCTGVLYITRAENKEDN